MFTCPLSLSCDSCLWFDLEVDPLLHTFLLFSLYLLESRPNVWWNLAYGQSQKKVGRTPFLRGHLVWKNCWMSLILKHLFHTAATVTVKPVSTSCDHHTSWIFPPLPNQVWHTIVGGVVHWRTKDSLHNNVLENNGMEPSNMKTSTNTNHSYNMGASGVSQSEN